MTNLFINDKKAICMIWVIWFGVLTFQPLLPIKKVSHGHEN